MHRQLSLFEHKEKKQTVEKPQGVRPKIVTVNAQTSPINIEQGSPHTPVDRGDWSFDEGEFPPLRPPSILPTPSRPLSPLKQRKPRRICTELFVNIEEPEETEREVTSEIVSQPPKTKGAKTVEKINKTREVDDESVIPRKHTEKKKNNKPLAERVETSRPSLNRIEASPILFSENSNEGSNVGMTTKEIQRTYKMVRGRLPHTELYFPIIHFSEDLPWEEQIYLDQINDYIQDKLNYIVELPVKRFKVEQDLIHWTPETAKAML